MNRFRTLGLAAAAVFAASTAQASLIGDEVRITWNVLGFTALDVTTTVSDPGVEATFIGGGTFALDLFADSLVLTLDFRGTGSIGAPNTWTVEDMDWVGMSGVVTGLTLTSGNAGLISGTSFTADSVTIDFVNVTSPPEIQSWEFAIQTAHAPVPAPAALPLAAAGLAGLTLLRRRTS